MSRKDLENILKRHNITDFCKRDANSILEIALEFLSHDYKEVRNGVFVNTRTGAVFRMLDYDLTGHRGKHKPHVHYESDKYKFKYHVIIDE